jgi:hypothetical protein
MDFFPDLGEPGLIDELFYFGPVLLQVLLGMLGYWLTGRMMLPDRRARLAAMLGIVLTADFLVLLAIIVVLTRAIP